MPTEVLNQLRVLRESMAESLRQDARYLTLTALDKSIAEISNVPGAADQAPAEVLGQLRVLRENIADAQRKDPRYLTLSSLDTSIAEIANVVGVTDHAPAARLSFETPAGAASPLPGEKKTLVQPVAETAAVLTSAGVAAEVVHAQNHASGSGGSQTDRPAVGSDDAEGGADDPEADPAGASLQGPIAEAEDAHAPAAGSSFQESIAEAEDAHAPAAGASPQQPTFDAEEAHAPAAGIFPEGKAGGYIPMQARAGALQYQPAMSVKFGRLPNKVDLRSLMTPIEDQGATSSCVANAVAGAYEYWIKKASRQDQTISRLFVYYNARWRDGSQDEDEGSAIQLAMEGLQKFGACHEHVWPLDAHLVTKKPGAAAYQDAAPFKVQDMAQVPLKLDAWKQALAEGKPIVFGCLVFEAFDECSRNGGVVPMPAPEDIGHTAYSCHAMCVVGYSDAEKVFIVRNSWGPGWGDKGFCYMPYAYLMNPKFNDGDCWVFVPKVPSQPPREVWLDDTAPVTNDGRGVDAPIETYSVAQYQALAVDLFEPVRQPFNTVVREDFSEYVTMANQSQWSRMESVDVRGYLASAAAMAAVSSAMTGDFWNDETTDADQDADEVQDDEASDAESDSDEWDDEEADTGEGKAEGESGEVHKRRDHD